jgi:hypothetical protein
MEMQGSVWMLCALLLDAMAYSAHEERLISVGDVLLRMMSLAFQPLVPKHNHQLQVMLRWYQYQQELGLLTLQISSNLSKHLSWFDPLLEISYSQWAPQDPNFWPGALNSLTM